MRLNINTSFKTQAIIALLISLWLVVFLVIIAPFDIAELPFQVRLMLMPVYGVISFGSYMILVPLQNWVFRQVGKWTLLHETAFTVLFHIITLLVSFLYYQSAWVNGDYSFTRFTTQVYSPIFFILLTILIVLRWFLFRKTSASHQAKMVLQGDNKRDALHLRFSDLICISSADNYVEVSYLAGHYLRKKLLRNTLKNMAAAHPGLLRVHRSHLINPAHFIEWIDTATIQLTQMKVPVSGTYKETLLTLSNPSP